MIRMELDQERVMLPFVGPILFMFNLHDFKAYHTISFYTQPLKTLIFFFRYKLNAGGRSPVKLIHFQTQSHFQIKTLVSQIEPQSYLMAPNIHSHMSSTVRTPAKVAAPQIASSVKIAVSPTTPSPAPKISSAALTLPSPAPTEISPPAANRLDEFSRRICVKKLAFASPGTSSPAPTNSPGAFSNQPPSRAFSDQARDLPLARSVLQASGQAQAPGSGDLSGRHLRPSI